MSLINRKIRELYGQNVAVTTRLHRYENRLQEETREKRKTTSKLKF